MNVQQFMKVIGDSVDLNDDQFQKVFHSAFALKNETDWLARGHSIVSSANITLAFTGTNFGLNPNHREIVNNSLLKISCGYSTGSTTKAILKELGLLGEKHITKLGKSYLWEVYSFGKSY